MEARQSLSVNDVHVAVIGGSGFYAFPDLCNVEEMSLQTPFGDVTGIHIGSIANVRVAFLARHGAGHKVPPHKINYQANIWALKSVGVQQILAVNAVGGITSLMAPGALVLPDQIIDYTYGRKHTFASVLSDDMNHIDFTEPFSKPLREVIKSALTVSAVDFVDGAVLGCTQGPRLETAAEIQRLRRDGCDLVGMTSMPEAALARELNMEYASICTVVNWCAGLSTELITLADIHAVLTRGAPVLRQTLSAVIRAL